MNTSDHHTSALKRITAIIEEIIILPFVLLALALKILFKITLSILIRILDYAFPVLLQVMRFPLFTARIVGDGITAFLRTAVTFLPVSSAKRDEWRELLSRYWSWLRQKISYKAFEEAVHDAFERGMAWVFRKCRTLTPRSALVVIAGAVLWLPASFGAASAMHAALIAKAASLPAWMQLLHPLATIIAKSKLLVLPVYPAAWPQAKKHPVVQELFRVYGYFARLHLVHKTVRRYRETELALGTTANALGRAAFLSRLKYLHPLLAGANDLAAWIRNRLRAANTRSIEGLSRFPLIGAIVRSYTAQYGDVRRQHAERFSERVSSFFERWSIKLSAEYYEAREKDEVARRDICEPPQLKSATALPQDRSSRPSALA